MPTPVTQEAGSRGADRVRLVQPVKVGARICWLTFTTSLASL